MPVRTFAGGLAALVSLAAVARAQDGSLATNYPFVPREETGVARFLDAHPQYDGRGVVIAIFDTGVDPGAAGMQVTSDGKPKIVDLIDGSGSGDVDTSTVVEPNDGRIMGLTGRTLKLDPRWTNPSGKYQVGMKRAYELYPGGLVNRLKERRQKKLWDPRQRAAVNALERQLADWEAAHPAPDETRKKEREELETRLAQLNELQEKYDDPGPIFDCVVWNDGAVWRAAIDTDEDGDLADEQALTNYRLERQYATFSDEDLMNYAVNIYNDGKLLSIVVDSGSHGTHVAGIVAANFPDQPELNGIAPGAQIVSVKIGDTRLGATSVGTGEIRGLIGVLQNRCDLINMSFGGPTADPDEGRTIELYSEIVNKHNVIFVCSAGNEGPALSSAGGPGATTEALFGVGAFVSPQMMDIQYSLREKRPPIQFTWSSRGPTTDGALGIKFSAPGAAISPVPNWELQRNAMMNGTSMAAPNACGGIALLLSALKAEGASWTPHRIRRALENTAVPVQGVEIFALGRGLVQIDKAYEYLKAYREFGDQDVRFEVRISSRGGARGIYLREPFEVDRPLEARVTVSPLFHEDAPSRERVDFEMRCKVESTAPWISVGENLVLMHGGRNLDIRVDPTGLEPGPHYAEIQGFDASRPDRGPIFRVPITVIRPLTIDASQARTEELSLEAGRIERRFIAVPEGATWVDVRIRRLDDEEPRRLLLHTVQLLPGQAYSQNEFKEYITVGPDADEIRSIAVTGGRTFELALSQFWSSLGACRVRVDLEFHGVVPTRDVVLIDGGQLAQPLQVTTPLGPERIAPRATLDTLRQTLRPKKSEIRPLDPERDTLPENRQIFELIAEYSFTLDEKAKVTPRVATSEILEYEDSLASQMYMVFDSAKRWIASGAADPTAVSLEKGDYTIRFQIRHDQPMVLEHLKDVPLMLDRTLEKPAALRFMSDPDQVYGEGKWMPRTLARGGRAMIWIAGPESEKLPKAAQPGDLLLGSIRFSAPDEKLPGEGERPGGYPVVYRVPPKPAAEKDKKLDKGDDEQKSTDEKVREALRDAKVAQLAKLRDPNDAAVFDRLLGEVLADDPNHLPALIEALKRADGKLREESLQAVVDAADRIIAAIDRDALAAHYGVNLDPDDKAAAKVRKEMDERKSALVEALHRRAKALFDLAAKQEAGTEARKSADAAAEAAFADLAKWVDTTETDYLPLHIDRMARTGKPGEALKLLSRKIADSRPDKALREQRARLFDQLGWPHWKEYEERWLLISFPKDYPPF